jgi:hypothetical protein
MSLIKARETRVKIRKTNDWIKETTWFKHCTELDTLDFATVKTTVKNLFSLFCVHTVYLFQELALGELAKTENGTLIVPRTRRHLRNHADWYVQLKRTCFIAIAV